MAANPADFPLRFNAHSVSPFSDNDWGSRSLLLTGLKDPVTHEKECYQPSFLLRNTVSGTCSG